MLIRSPCLLIVHRRSGPRSVLIVHRRSGPRSVLIVHRRSGPRSVSDPDFRNESRTYHFSLVVRYKIYLSSL